MIAFNSAITGHDNGGFSCAITGHDDDVLFISDLHDSSSNDSMSADTSLSKKEAKVKKLLKQERALYVPPGRKRPGYYYTSITIIH